MRDRLLALVYARLERFWRLQDPSVMLDPAAPAEVAALLGGTPVPDADLEAAVAAGLVRWLRYLILDKGEDQQELASALALLRPVYALGTDRSKPGPIVSPACNGTVTRPAAASLA